MSAARSAILPCSRFCVHYVPIGASTGASGSTIRKWSSAQGWPREGRPVAFLDAALLWSSRNAATAGWLFVCKTPANTAFCCDSYRRPPVGAAVTIAYGKHRRDRYGRTLAYLTKADGVDFGLEMLTEGLCADYSAKYPHPRQDAYRAAKK